MERLTLDEQLTAARMARHWVCEHCPEEHLPAARRWIAELLTGELVANALEHGRGPLVLTLTHDAEGIVVGISDGNRRVPSLRDLDTTETAGRGIALVDALATAWGTYPSRYAATAQGSTDSVADAEGWPVPDEEWDGEAATCGHHHDVKEPASSESGEETTPAGKTVWFHLAVA